MRPLGHLIGGLRRLFGRVADEQEMDDEIAHYLTLATEEELRAGVPRAEAERRARAKFGGVQVAKEEVRSGGWEARLETLWQDLRYAVRRLRHQPGVTLAAIVSLALGIGANTAIFSLVNATLLRSLPVADIDRLYFVQKFASAPGVYSYPVYRELRDGNQVLDGLIAWGGITVSLTEGELPELATGAIVSGNYFDVLGVQAQRGRLLTQGDDLTPGAHPVVVVSHRFWQNRLGGRADVVGHDLRMNGRIFSIIGVTPPEFQGAQLGVTRDLYVPLMMQALLRPPRGGYSGERDPDLLQVRGNSWLFLAGRLKPGVSEAAAVSGLERLVPEDERPPLRADGTRPTTLGLMALGTGGDPAQRAQLSSVARLLLGVVGLVLLVACANVANLLLSRATARQHEIATRLSLGAGRPRLVRQLLTEALVLAALGGLSGLALAWGAIRAFQAAPPPPGAIPIQLEFSIDGWVLVFTFGLSLLTGVLFGLAPALRATQLSLVSVMKSEGFVAAGRSRRFSLRDLLVVAQVSMSLVLLVSAGLLVKSLRQTQAIEPGFAVDHLVTAPLNINLLRYTRAQGVQFYRDVIERMESIPGVSKASVVRWVPLSGGGATRSLMIEGRAAPANLFQSQGGGFSGTGDPGILNVAVTGPGYLETMGIPLLRGRDFGAIDRDSTTRVAIINEAFVRQHFPSEDPLGKRFSNGSEAGPWFEIVGVAKDIRFATLTAQVEPLAYLPLSQNHETGMQLVVRAEHPAAVTTQIGRVLHELEKNLPVTGIQPVSESIGAALYVARAGARLLTGFGLLAVLLAAIGLYGVMSYAVTRRTREIALRMAIGADSGRVLREVLTRGLGLVLVGTAVGVVGALFATRLVAGFLYGVSRADLVTYVVMPLLLVGIALPACLLPARRATRVAPMEAIRQG